VQAVDAEIYSLPQVTGAIVVALNPPDGPAAAAGLRPGDIVESLDGQPISDDVQLITLLAQQRPGQRVRLGILRDGHRNEVGVQLGEFARPPAPRAPVPERANGAEQVLGFAVRDITPADARRLGFRGEGGVVVQDLPQWGAAALAGIRADAIIVAVNGQRVGSARQVRDLARGVRPGTAVSVIMYRSDVGETLVNYRTRY
jgi:serine protease Do